MISTNVNLKSLRVEWIGHDNFFANQPGQILLRISHSHGRSHYLISAQTRRMDFLKSKPIAGTISEIAPRQGAMLSVPATFKKRGVYACPRISISTVYPLGLFRSWTYYSPGEEILVYPELREGTEPLPESIDAGVGDSQKMSRDSQHEDFREHARFQLGESHHHVDWKAYARHGELLSKRYEAHSPLNFILRWDSFQRGDVELALSQIAFVVENLRNRGASFSIEIPGFHLPIGNGEGHASRALEALARFEAIAS